MKKINETLWECNLISKRIFKINKLSRIHDTGVLLKISSFKRGLRGVDLIELLNVVHLSGISQIVHVRALKVCLSRETNCRAVAVMHHNGDKRREKRLEWITGQRIALWLVTTCPPSLDRICFPGFRSSFSSSSSLTLKGFPGWMVPNVPKNLISLMFVFF